MSPQDYGESAADLEALRQLVEASCPLVQFTGFTVRGARFGEYSFRLPPAVSGSSFSRSALVQAPVTPKGMPRARLGLWRYRMSHGRGFPVPWIYGKKMETVADWICRMAIERLYGEGSSRLSV